MKNDEQLRDRLVPLLSELIANRCVNDGDPDSGNEILSARTLARFFDGYGIESEILEFHPGRANLLVRIPGNDPMAPSLMYMGHLDVVPAREEEWSFDPFAGDLCDGYVRGRGSLDMLNQTAAMAVAVAELVQSGRSLPGDLLFLAVADEESTGRFGARWLVEREWDRVKTDYMVTETGGLFTGTGSDSPITVTVGEKGVAWSRISFQGRAGHGSIPYRSDNAALKAADAALRISRYRPRPSLHPTYLSMADRLGEGFPEKLLLSTSWGIDAGISLLYGRDPGRARSLHAASRLTLSPNMIAAGEKINIIADRGDLSVDARIMPDQTVEEVQEALLAALGPLGEESTIEFTEFFPSNVSELDTPLMRAIEQVAGLHHPGVRLVPFFSGGASDGRYWRQRGTTVYGFSLYDRRMTLNEFSRMLHGTDERVSLESLRLSLEFFRELPDRFFGEAGAGSGPGMHEQSAGREG